MVQLFVENIPCKVLGWMHFTLSSLEKGEGSCVRGQNAECAEGGVESGRKKRERGERGEEEERKEKGRERGERMEGGEREGEIREGWREQRMREKGKRGEKEGVKMIRKGEEKRRE